MKLFNKKERCVIVVDEVTISKVQDFANEHSIRNSNADVIIDGELSLIGFDTKERRSNIIEQIKKTFEQCFKVSISNNLIFILSKQGA